MHLGIYQPIVEESPAGVGRYAAQISNQLSQHDSRLSLATQKGRPAWSGSTTTVSLPGFKRAPEGFFGRAERLAWLRSSRVVDFASSVDVVFAPAQEGPLREVGVPVCLVVHDIIALRQPQGRRLDSLATRWLLPKMLSNASHIIAVSGHTKSDLVQRLRVDPDRVSVVYEGVDDTVFYPRSESEIQSVKVKHSLGAPYLLYAGSLAPHKNVALLIQVLSEIRARGHKVDLVLVGNYTTSDRQRIWDMATPNAVERAVKMLGYVSDEILATLMSGAQAFMFPSLYEGFGLAPLEAMACGAPVFASNASAIPEVVGDAGFLLDPLSADAWVAALERMISDEVHAESCRQRSLKRATRFTWQRAGDETWSILTSLRGDTG